MALRAVEADTATRNQEMVLWRGMRDVKLPEEFMQDGGTEVWIPMLQCARAAPTTRASNLATQLAPMSTTASLEIAMQYSSSSNAVLLRLRTSNFYQRGSDISFLSAFPHEKEILFPPLTYLRATQDTEVIQIDEATFTVVDVEPQQ